jgi:heterodisulfide reductase subunit B
MKFSYFPGCTVHSTSLEYGKSTDAVFETLGAELVEINDWNCCGAAATHSINHLHGISRLLSRLTRAPW